MRIALSVLLSLCFLVSFGQNDTTKYFKSVDYGWSYKRLYVREALVLPYDTIVNKLGFVGLNGKLYIGNGIKWTLVSGTSIDTNRFVKYVDTASMLAPYAKSIQLSTKLNISDTASMLSAYAKTTQLSLKLNSVDTASLSNRINIKIDSLKKSNDSVYAYKNGIKTFQFKDSIGGGSGGSTDTTSLSNRINLKVNISDTSVMLSPYLRKVDTASLSNRINNTIPYTGATTNVNLGIRNITANAYFNGFTSMIATGTTVTLTVDSTPVHLVTGSGGQTFKLPLATTLPSGTIFSFNNNQSSGVISVNNNSNTLVKSVPSGAYLTLELTDNTTATGTWDAHFQTPSNAAWSTNTLDWAGSFTNGTWNGSVVAYNRGGTGSSSAFTQGGIAFGSTTSALGTTSAGTSGQLLTSAGTGTPTWTNALDTTSLSNRINLKLNSSDSTIYQTKYRSDTARTNIYSGISSKLTASDTSVFQRKADSTTYQTKYRSDTSRTNIYNGISSKLNITDTSVFQRKSLPSYTFIANNTTGTANGTIQTFKDSGQKVYSGTITWSGTTAPSGTTNNTYRWSQIGKLVTLRINLSYSVAGTGVLSASCPIPSDVPVPEIPTGFNASTAIISLGVGGLGGSTISYGVSTTPSGACTFRATATGYELVIIRASGAWATGWAIVQYFAQ